MSNATAVKPEPRGLLPFCATALVGCLVLACAAVAYSRARHIPSAAALPILTAFLVEFLFYLLIGFPAVRARLFPPASRALVALLLFGSALLPYLLCSIPLGVFRPAPALAIAALFAAVAFWFVPPIHRSRLAALRDCSLLLLLAAAILSGLLRWVYPLAAPRLSLEILGHISLVRLAILAVLLIRGAPQTHIGFVPTLRELGIGGAWFLAVVTVAIPLGSFFGLLHRSRHPLGLWPSLALLLGVFWVVALSEEFFFRGLLQQWIHSWTGSFPVALVITSVAFGACHLGFRGIFPNWGFAGLAAILGLVYGIAFRQCRSVRASMVTHALVVGFWRIFLA